MVTVASIVTVMAHADDAELWAGATLARHARAGATVTIAVARSDTPRDHEASEGAATLGADLCLLDDLTPRTVAQLLNTHRPEVVITHHPDDIHPDHRLAAEALLTALPDVVIATGYPHRVYACDGYNSLDRQGRPLDLPVIIDGTDTWDSKMQALRCHQGTQPIDTHFGLMAEALGRLHGRRIERDYAEAFRALPILGRLPAAATL